MTGRYQVRPQLRHALLGVVHDEYRKRPVTVEAHQVMAHDRTCIRAGQSDAATDWPGWFRTAVTTGDIYADADGSLHIQTLEGTSYGIATGYWIVKGVKGEMWPVRDDVFRETYERVKA